MHKEINIDEVLEKSNNTFRKVSSKGTSGYIYDNSIDTAKRIVKELAKKVLRTNHVMLVAKMQSGKTSVCNSVINIITQSKLDITMGIDKFMFISGMNDCGLKDQTYLRLTQQVIGANIDNVYIGKRSKKNLSDNKFFVLKNSDLMEYDDDINNTLIFIDESHYGSNERNILTKFLVKHDIDWKNTNELIKRNIYIVSVSATPFDELVSDTIQCKTMVELKTSDEYVGVSEYIKNDLVFNANKDDVSTDGKIFDYIMEAHERMLNKNNGCGVIFIRTRNFDVIEENAYVIKHFDIYEMYSSGSNIEYERLSSMIDDMISKNEYNIKCKTYVNSSIVDMPIVENRPLIVLIKGAFRAGITIKPHHKDYVFMVYDFSMKSDTTAQALLGRMCGYRDSSSSITNTHFYINKKYADMYSAWENDFQNRNAIPCDKMKYEWVEVGDYVNENEAEISSRCCGNRYIQLSDDVIQYIYKNGKNRKSRVDFMYEILPNILSDYHVDIEYDYIGEALISGKNNYTLSSQEKRFNSFTDESAVFVFRPHKVKKFIMDTDRDYLTIDDIGKRAVYIVLDCEIYENGESITIKGNKRLLIYYTEVAQRIRVANRKGMYKPHKDTNIKQ